MGGPTIFQFIGNLIDSSLNNFVNVTAGNVITMFSIFALGCTTLYLSVMGYMIAFGFIEQPMSHFLKTCLKLIFIAAFALNADMYSEWIVGAVHSLETDFTAAFAGTDSGNASTSVYQVVDEALGKGWGVSGDLWEKASNRGWTEIGMAFGEYFNSIVIAIATGLIAVPAGGMIIVAKAGLTIMLGIGPFFIMALMWPPTARFFDSWFGQVMTYIMRIALVAAVLGLAFKGFDTMIRGVDLNSEQNPLFTSLVLITFTVVMFWILHEANNVAGQLAGGISSAAVTLRGMAQGASIPFRAAGKAINGRSTRRDMQSGQMVTAGRLNHMVAGNTLWNPAYKQHVMENMGKNWGRAKGGSVGQ
jgi:type IV secretion system protein VirB6